METWAIISRSFYPVYHQWILTRITNSTPVTVECFTQSEPEQNCCDSRSCAWLESKRSYLEVLRQAPQWFAVLAETQEETEFPYALVDIVYMAQDKDALWHSFRSLIRAVLQSPFRWSPSLAPFAPLLEYPPAPTKQKPTGTATAVDQIDKWIRETMYTAKRRGVSSPWGGICECTQNRTPTNSVFRTPTGLKILERCFPENALGHRTTTTTDTSLVLLRWSTSRWITEALAVPDPTQSSPVYPLAAAAKPTAVFHLPSKEHSFASTIPLQAFEDGAVFGLSQKGTPEAVQFIHWSPTGLRELTPEMAMESPVMTAFRNQWTLRRQREARSSRVALAGHAQVLLRSGQSQDIHYGLDIQYDDTNGTWAVEIQTLAGGHVNENASRPSLTAYRTFTDRAITQRERKAPTDDTQHIRAFLSPAVVDICQQKAALLVMLIQAIAATNRRCSTVTIRFKTEECIPQQVPWTWLIRYWVPWPEDLIPQVVNAQTVVVHRGYPPVASELPHHPFLQGVQSLPEAVDNLPGTLALCWPWLTGLETPHESLARKVATETKQTIKGRDRQYHEGFHYGYRVAYEHYRSEDAMVPSKGTAGWSESLGYWIASPIPFFKPKDVACDFHHWPSSTPDNWRRETGDERSARAERERSFQDKINKVSHITLEEENQDQSQVTESDRDNDDAKEEEPTQEKDEQQEETEETMSNRKRSARRELPGTHKDAPIELLSSSSPASSSQESLGRPGHSGFISDMSQISIPSPIPVPMTPPPTDTPAAATDADVTMRTIVSEPLFDLKALIPHSFQRDQGLATFDITGYKTTLALMNSLVKNRHVAFNGFIMPGIHYTSDRTTQFAVFEQTPAAAARIQSRVSHVASLLEQFHIWDRYTVLRMGVFTEFPALAEKTLYTTAMQEDVDRSYWTQLEKGKTSVFLAAKPSVLRSTQSEVSAILETRFSRSRATAESTDVAQFITRLRDGAYNPPSVPSSSSSPLTIPTIFVSFHDSNRVARVHPWILRPNGWPWRAIDHALDVPRRFCSRLDVLSFADITPSYVNAKWNQLFAIASDQLVQAPSTVPVQVNLERLQRVALPLRLNAHQCMDPIFLYMIYCAHPREVEQAMRIHTGVQHPRKHYAMALLLAAYTSDEFWRDLSVTNAQDLQAIKRFISACVVQNALYTQAWLPHDPALDTALYFPGQLSVLDLLHWTERSLARPIPWRQLEAIYYAYQAHIHTPYGYLINARIVDLLLPQGAAAAAGQRLSMLAQASGGQLDGVDLLSLWQNALTKSLPSYTRMDLIPTPLNAPALTAMDIQRQVTTVLASPSAHQDEPQGPAAVPLLLPQGMDKDHATYPSYQEQLDTLKPLILKVENELTEAHIRLLLSNVN